MNCNEATSSALVSRPLTERIVAEIFDALRSSELAFAGLWKRRSVPPTDARSFDALAHLNEHTLKDIGAPHWLVARAAEEREARHLRWIEFDVR